MTSWRNLLVIAILLALVAGGLRFAHLGDWSFGGDEFSAFAEEHAFFHPSPDSRQHDLDHLPRLLPLGYAVMYLGDFWFGTDEFDSRIMMALLGTASVVIVFLGLARPLGLPIASASAVLLMLWPEHLFQSQNHRFYMPAGCCAALCMVLGAQAWTRFSWRFALLASLAALASILVHTVQGLLLAGLFTGLLAASLTERKSVPWTLLMPVMGAGLVALGLLVFYLYPLGKGWNAEETWGYGSAHSSLGAIAQIGWPIVLLAPLGALCLWNQNRGQGVYWTAFAVLWLLGSALLPRLMVYHPQYIFPLAFSMVVLAGSAVGHIFAILYPVNPLAGVAWMTVACALNIPSVVSYYRDGSRHDHRTVGRFLEAHWQSGDRCAATASTLLAHYAPSCPEGASLNGGDLKEIQKLAQAPARLWIVIPSGRGGLGEDLREWLSKNCSQELLVRQKRLDYYDYTVEVFLHLPDPKR